MRMRTSIPEKIEVWTASQEVLPSPSAGSSLAILSSWINLNRASESSRACAGSAVYKRTKGDRRADARAFLALAEGKDDFYAKSADDIIWKWYVRARREKMRHDRLYLWLLLLYFRLMQPSWGHQELLENSAFSTPGRVRGCTNWQWSSDYMQQAGDTVTTRWHLSFKSIANWYHNNMLNKNNRRALRSQVWPPELNAAFMEGGSKSWFKTMVYTNLTNFQLISSSLPADKQTPYSGLRFFGWLPKSSNEVIWSIPAYSRIHLPTRRREKHRLKKQIASHMQRFKNLNRDNPSGRQFYNHFIISTDHVIFSALALIEEPMLIPTAPGSSAVFKSFFCTEGDTLSTTSSDGTVISDSFSLIGGGVKRSIHSAHDLSSSQKLSNGLYRLPL